MGRTRAPQGFTLVELLVVIAIIGILVALLLPAVQAAREAGRRTACASNMRQHGLAIHNYHDVNNVLPPAGRNYGWCRNPQRAPNKIVQNLNGWVLLLPYLEQSSIYDAMRIDGAFSATTVGNDNCCPPTKTLGTLAGDPVANGNARFLSMTLPVFHCASDPGDPYLPGNNRYYGISGSSSIRARKNHYDFCVYTSYECNAWRLYPQNQYAFGENTELPLGRVTDGTSNTVFVCEGTYDVYNGNRAAWGFRGWVQQGIDFGTSAGINNWTYRTQYQVGRLGSWQYPGSLHPTGMLVTMGDAAVRFVRETLDYNTRRRLSLIADGYDVKVP